MNLLVGSAPRLVFLIICFSEKRNNDHIVPGRKIPYEDALKGKTHIFL